jgi:hypothetical protein
MLLNYVPAPASIDRGIGYLPAARTQLGQAIYSFNAVSP